MNDKEFDVTLDLPERTKDQENDLATMQDLFDLLMEKAEEQFDKGFKTGFVQGRGIRIDFKDGRILSFSGTVNLEVVE